VSIQAFVAGLPRLANVLEATEGTLKNINNICTLAINSIQLMPALKVNIIFVHPRGVVFPRALATSQG
jgi:hypothetical protein